MRNFKFSHKLSALIFFRAYFMSISTVSHVALILLKLTSCCVCYNILVYNQQVGNSHAGFWSSVADHLVEAGHNVVSYILRKGKQHFSIYVLNKALPP